MTASKIKAGDRISFNGHDYIVETVTPCKSDPPGLPAIEITASADNITSIFLSFVRDGLTRRELETNIKKDPAIWARFESWLPKLPTE